MRPAPTAQPCRAETNSMAASGGTLTVPATDTRPRHAPAGEVAAADGLTGADVAGPDAAAAGLSEDAAEPAACPDSAGPHPAASELIPQSAAARQHPRVTD